MRWICAITLADGIIGFGFHVRGIHRKPGGWSLPLTNIIMGPPIFAPLLFGTAAYLGLMASYLRRENDEPLGASSPATDEGWRTEIREGRFQQHLAGVAALWAVLSGLEAWYSHYKSRFRIWAQWTPVLLTPIQFGACVGAIFSERVARRLLPVTSGLAMVDGMVGFGLSRAWHCAASGRKENVAIQHPLWTADLCAHAVCSLWSFRIPRHAIAQRKP